MIANIIINSVENVLLAICSMTSAKYDSIGHGNIGRKSPNNHKNNIIAHIMINIISIYIIKKIKRA